jgi:hypothetical protein
MPDICGRLAGPLRGRSRLPKALQRSQSGPEPERWKQVQRPNLPVQCDYDRRSALKPRFAWPEELPLFVPATVRLWAGTARSSWSVKVRGMRQVTARSAAPVAPNRKRNSAVRQLPAPAGCPRSKAGCRARSPLRSEQVRSEVSTSFAVHPQQCATSNFLSHLGRFENLSSVSWSRQDVEPSLLRTFGSRAIKLKASTDQLKR